MRINNQNRPTFEGRSGIMRIIGTQQIKWNKKRTILFLCLLILIKIIIQLALYENGFLSVSADEFARGIRAAEWALNPSVNMLSDIKDTWLPFEKYLNGSLLIFWPDVIWAPRLTVFIASCLVSVTLFFLIDLLFENKLVAALSITFLAFQPWYAWLSGTPMLEMYYFLFFFLGAYLLVFWVKREKDGFWLLAGLSFLIATGFHVQSWVYINLFNLFTIGYLVKNVKRKKYKEVFSLIGFYVLGNSLITVFTLIEFIDTGRIFGFLDAHTNYSKWFYDGYSTSVLEKALYYPKLILHNVSIVVWLLIFVAFLFFLNERVKIWKLFPLFYSLLALSINSLMNIISVPATAAPGRYSLIYLILLAPYAAYGLVSVLSLRLPVSKKWLHLSLKIFPVIIYIYSIFWGVGNLTNYDRVVSMDAVKTGEFINEQLDQYSSNNPPIYMVELIYWDFLGVVTAGGYYDHVVYDREYDIYNRDSESVFNDELNDPCSELFSENVGYIALQSKILKNRAESMVCLRPLAQNGSWTVYEFEAE